MNQAKTKTRVAVIFGPDHKVKPVWFELNYRKHEVRETTYQWRSSSGNTPLMHYAVTDGEALYELIYNSSDNTWNIAEQQAV